MRIVKKAVLESAFIVFGVVLALVANEWRQWQIDQSKAYEALSSIVVEIEANRKSVVDSRDYHASLIELLRDHSSDQPLKVEYFPRGFISPAPLSRSAWDSASETNAFNNLPFSKVLQTGKLYAQQEDYIRQVESNSTIIYHTLFKSGYDGVLANPRGVRTMIGTFAYREEKLLESYERYLLAQEE